MYWLVKSEPDVYSWQTFVEASMATWDGVRNYQARNHLRSMQLNDLVLFYHSNKGREIVGLAQISKEAFPDPTIPEDPRWLAVQMTPVAPFSKSVTLAQIKKDAILQNIGLIKQSRLSVMPIEEQAFFHILELVSFDYSKIHDRR